MQRLETAKITSRLSYQSSRPDARFGHSLQGKTMQLSTSLRLLWVALPLLSVCGCDTEEPRDTRPELSKRPDRWVCAVHLDPDSKASYVSATKQFLIFSLSDSEDLRGLESIRVGDEINGLSIGAIRCSFQWQDAFYNDRQYMWRGRGQCMAGRSKEEIENAVAPNGDKRFDYIAIRPVSL